MARTDFQFAQRRHLYDDQTTQTPPPSSRDLSKDETHKLIASDKVEGTTVFDSKGEKLGTTRKIMIGKLDGKVRYVVMGCGGLFGMGEDNFPLPWDGLDYDTKLDGYKLNGVTKADFSAKKAPSYGRDEEPDWSDDYDRKVRDYYVRNG